MKVIGHNELQDCDLTIDAVYEGGTANNVADDVISKLMPGTGNRGGFRPAGRGRRKNFVVLYTSGRDLDWPDTLDASTGRFVYWGDNTRPGHGLHETVRGGNKLLRNVFGRLDQNDSGRLEIPPFFVFRSCPTERSSWSIQFLGLAAPGCPGTAPTDSLVAVWKSIEGQRFLNYLAVFTVLDIPVVSRQWITALAEGQTDSAAAPSAWREWVGSGQYEALTATPTSEIRSIEEQLPQNGYHRELLRTIHEHFRETPIAFESFAAKIFQFHDNRVVIDEITRAVRDGGRDAIGRYRLGVESDPVHVDFALEAKCYDPGLEAGNPKQIGVKEVARLIARLRHRQFGVIVTTSVVGKQAYTEMRDDGHPVVVISGRDIVDILVAAGFKTKEQLSGWLANEF